MAKQTESYEFLVTVDVEFDDEDDWNGRTPGDFAEAVVNYFGGRDAIETDGFADLNAYGRVTDVISY